jgi:hypothetical protein
MKLSKSVKQDLDKKFQKVVEAPEGFGFFEAIHDFIKEIEREPAFADGLSYKTKINRDLNIPTKYGYLRQIYQGLEDASAKTSRDLGHARFTNVRDLNRIKNQDLSDNNFFWKKRALFRKLAGEIYERLGEGAKAV